MSISQLILDSWKDTNGINKTDDLLYWINELNSNTYVEIQEKSIYQDVFWFYDDYSGEVLNRKRSFFSVKGMRRFEDGHFVGEQPIIVQPEIGYLGIICKIINGVLHFLMQAKIEPGNINCVQISPTIQATKSNFTRVHGGKLPSYFEYFDHSERYRIIYDQIQSEQAMRFYKKRNRNMIILVDDEIEVLPNFKWMTLGQIKQLLKIDNLVNMDTRTVLSGLPLYLLSDGIYSNSRLNDSDRLYFVESDRQELMNAFHRMNDYKMFKDIRLSTVPLYELANWEISEFGIVCKDDAAFMVRYYDIEIEGREVQKWFQPLFKATGIATFGLITSVIDGTRKVLVKLVPEFGSFDKVEFGPTIQWEALSRNAHDEIEVIFQNHISNKNGIITDVLLSEEGGRFYHEQNRNVIIDVNQNELKEIPANYSWLSISNLSRMIQFNNVVNIQLRNLISLLDFDVFFV